MSLVGACRSCAARGLEPILDLGALPLANALLTREQLEAPEARYPLELVFCPACALVQITETVPPERLFGEYLYFSSFSDSFVEHARLLAERLVQERGLGPHSLVVELASNDGYLLQHYLARGVPVLGVEPARNVAAVAEARGIPTRVAFFGRELAEQLVAAGRRADLLHAHNVLAHVADLNGFVRGLATLLAPNGLAVIEVPYVRELVERLEFDTIYHEHLCYFGLGALVPLFERHGLRLTGAERVVVHGGSLRVFAAHAGAGHAPAVAALLAEEQSAGLARIAFYRSFAARVAALRARLRATLVDLRGRGARLAVYGAAAKASVLLNCLELPPGTLEFVVDRSPHKQGRFLPGLRLPIRPVEALLDEQPDYALLTAWNLKDEVLAQQAKYRHRGGRFILPLPEVEIL